MKKGDIIEITIEQVAFGGDGIGRLDGQVVFVPYTVDGDVVRVEVTDLRKRYAKGRLTEILQPSKHRINALCADYTRCGGCCYQHINYGHQLFLKETQVRDAFERIGKISGVPLYPVMPSPEPYHYRLKADFHIMNQRGKKPIIGLMSGSSNRIVEITRCEIVDEHINQLLEDCRSSLRNVKRNGSGGRITLWATDLAKGSASKERSSKKTFVKCTVKDLVMMAPYDGFFQANQFLVSKMVDQVITAADLHGRETVIDAYSGSGLFTLFLAPLAGSFYAIEGDPHAIKAARKNTEQHGLDNVSFYEGDVAQVLKRDFASFRKPIDVLLLDPPRTGFGEGLREQIFRLSPRRIVYVSCNPATQARDIQRLIMEEYLLEFLQPIDMFPQTAHIEVIASLNRQN
ncbi:MAG: class I SAM-dependent RNA methyltransferase [Syntrophaceae bacterium]|nr:class I SAM-dependent RNA methyltransferase [Syntrophaceae bacterium]